MRPEVASLSAKVDELEGFKDMAATLSREKEHDRQHIEQLEHKLEKYDGLEKEVTALRVAFAYVGVAFGVGLTFEIFKYFGPGLVMIVFTVALIGAAGTLFGWRSPRM